MFRLKRPCSNCPFRKQQGERFQLHPERLDEIKKATAFQCHKTVVYGAGSRTSPGDKPQQCAGLMAVLHRDGEPNQIMQVAERLGHLDPTTLDPKKEAYGSWAQVVRAHKFSKRKRANGRKDG